MAPTQVNGVTMSAKRQHVIDALFQLPDYSLVPPEGKEIVPPGLQMKTLGMSTGSLARMEHDGIITRTMDVKRTKKISLANEWAPYAHERVTNGEAGKRRGRPRKAAGAKRGPYKRRTTGGGGKRTSTARIAAHISEEVLPPVGSQLTVFLVQQDPDGTYHVGLRNGTQSWLTQIEGHTQRVPV